MIYLYLGGRMRWCRGTESLPSYDLVLESIDASAQLINELINVSSLLPFGFREYSLSLHEFVSFIFYFNILNYMKLN